MVLVLLRRVEASLPQKQLDRRAVLQDGCSDSDLAL